MIIFFEKTKYRTLFTALFPQNLHSIKKTYIFAAKCQMNITDIYKTKYYETYSFLPVRTLPFAVLYP